MEILPDAGLTAGYLYDVHVWNITSEIWRHYYQVVYRAEGKFTAKNEYFQTTFDPTPYTSTIGGLVTYVEVPDQLTSTYTIPITYFMNTGTSYSPRQFLFRTSSSYQVPLVTSRLYTFHITVTNATGKVSGNYPNFNTASNPPAFSSTVTASTEYPYPGEVRSQTLKSDGYNLPFTYTSVPQIRVVCANECSVHEFMYHGDTAEHVIGSITVVAH